jgi:uncharacterized membrane protein
MTTLVVGTAVMWAMVGLIWMVRLVQYPMLTTYSALAPGAAAGEHQRRITKVVGLLIAVEGITALILLVDRPDTMAASSAWMAALLLALALGSTILVQVPLHGRLAEGHDSRAAQQLITTNWVRNAAWTTRGLVLACLLAT